MKKLFSISASLLLLSSALAADIDNDGLVIDRTITRVGHEFHALLAKDREFFFPEKRENITVYERPTANSGSIIWITYKDKVIYNVVLTPRSNNLKKKSEEALVAITKAIDESKEVIEDNPDLDNYDELNGNEK